MRPTRFDDAVGAMHANGRDQARYALFLALAAIGRDDTSPIRSQDKTVCQPASDGWREAAASYNAPASAMTSAENAP